MLTSSSLELSTAPPTSQYGSMTMLGFKYNSSTMLIEALDVGGPAYKDGRIKKADQLLAVDEEVVDEKNVESLLRGSDVPGSQVHLTLYDAKAGQVKQVELTRMACELIISQGARDAAVGSMRGGATYDSRAWSAQTASNEHGAMALRHSPTQTRSPLSQDMVTDSGSSPRKSGILGRLFEGMRVTRESSREVVADAHSVTTRTVTTEHVEKRMVM